MSSLTDRDVVEKWSHIALKLFPPQMDISVARENGSWIVCARWKDDTAGGAPRAAGANGVDVHFDEKSIADYLNAGVDGQLKCDLYIEAAISEKLQSFDPLEKARGRRVPERWAISLESSLAT